MRVFKRRTFRGTVIEGEVVEEVAPRQGNAGKAHVKQVAPAKRHESSGLLRELRQRHMGTGQVVQPHKANPVSDTCENPVRRMTAIGKGCPERKDGHFSHRNQFSDGLAGKGFADGLAVGATFFHLLFR